MQPNRTLLLVSFATALLLCKVHSAAISGIEESPSISAVSPSPSAVSVVSPASSSQMPQEVSQSSIMDELEEPCRRVRTEISVPYAGCKPNITKVKTCSTGSAISYEVYQPSESGIWMFSMKKRCKVQEYRIKPRRLMFECNGVMEEKRVFMAVPQACVWQEYLHASLLYSS